MNANFLRWNLKKIHRTESGKLLYLSSNSYMFTQKPVLRFFLLRPKIEYSFYKKHLVMVKIELKNKVSIRCLAWLLGLDDSLIDDFFKIHICNKFFKSYISKLCVIHAYNAIELNSKRSQNNTLLCNLVFLQ